MRLVPEARLELALCFQNRILNPACLPIPPLRQRMRSVGKLCLYDKFPDNLFSVIFAQPGRLGDTFQRFHDRQQMWLVGLDLLH